MDIGVWNPNAVLDNNMESANGDAGDEDYDYNDLQAVALLTNENVADFDWTKAVDGEPGLAASAGPLPSFSVGTPDRHNNLQPWMENGDIGQVQQTASKFSQEFRPKSPSEYIEATYSDYSGSYNSDQSTDDSDSDDAQEESGNENSCKVKEFGPKLVFKGDTAEAVEEPGGAKMKKMKSPEEEEMEEGCTASDDEPYEQVEDLLSLEWDWDGKLPNDDKSMEATCEDLLNQHRAILMKEALVPADKEIPIIPPFAHRPEENTPEETTADESKRQKHGRLASESPYILELTQILLGDHINQCGKESSTPTDDKEPVCSAPLSTRSCGPDPSLDVDFGFSFDEQPGLENHPGPSPSVILQAFTMSSANDGINLERLETIGDSFLKYAITTYLYCKYSSIHEGKLSYLRSRQVSNLHLYQLGKRKLLGGCMVATKFNPHDNWLPPGYVIPVALEEALITSGIPLNYWNMVDLQGMEQMSSEEVKALVKEKTDQILLRFGGKVPTSEEMVCDSADYLLQAAQDMPRFVPYNLLTQHSIPDKSIADCVEALIGAYLTACGPRGALLFMSWLGLKVLPPLEDGSFGYWVPPISPMVNRPFDAESMLSKMLAGFESFEDKIGYKFNDRYYLLQAFSHASYYSNRLTDCYQRLEFLGDAVLDYLITRYLYEDPRQHPPGALTDLRSALVNNTTFAVLAVRFDFHRYFKHYSHSLNQIMDKFIKAQEENGHCINEEV